MNGLQGRKDHESWLRVSNDHQVLSRSLFIIMPTDYPFKSFELIEFPKGKPGLARIIKPYVIYKTGGNTRLGFSQIGVKKDYEEIFRWKW